MAPAQPPLNQSQSTLLQHTLQNNSSSASLPSSSRSRHSSFSTNSKHSYNAHQSHPSLTISIRSFKKKGSHGSRRRSFDSAMPLEGTDDTLASEKRNRDFHGLFKSIPADDHLIEDFGCALQKDILLQGRLYVSQRHICFNANIFGWVTNLVIAYTDIVEIDKKTTAIIIPNAIQITTGQSKHFFASFLSREQAYDQMVDLWRQYVHLSESTLEDPPLPDLVTSEVPSSEEDKPIWNDSLAVPKMAAHDQERQNSLASLPVPKHIQTYNVEDEENDLTHRRRAVSEAGPRPSTEAIRSPTTPSPPPPPPVSPLPVSSTTATAVPSAPTQCQCDTHHPHIVMDQTYSCSLETLYQLLYHTDFVKKYLVDVEKSSDVSIGAWQKGQDVPLVRDMSYTKYLGGAIGPKSTKCILKDEITHLDLTRSITQQTTTQTPDVPSGSSFCVKTRVCMTWAEQESTRMVVSVLVSFSKSSWLKSTIEKASIDGQIHYYKGLDMAIRKYTASKQPPSDTRRKRHAPKRKTQPPPPPQPEPVSQGCLDVLQGAVSDGVSLVTGLFQRPMSSTSLTVFLLLVIVLTNVYIAMKMAQLGRRLPTSEWQPTESMDAWRWTHQRQAQSLWQWLDQVDPSPPVRRQQQQPRLLTYQPLTKPVPVMELEKMVVRAEQNVDHIHQLVKQQRRRLLQDL
ncbi:hypothetical protein DM01DRAFT_1338860 [Hesseltinella vesiculosa]|uniref:VASt domain-containing protein n=1 Tax=Hesseltinella vesiculosa TaxID=101127 RepID=A0A1X2G8Z5_9FUNG|nr:hypothetical protein DM01DRAFT_1338860 [Hesseltinella vesiculosa]